jgi:SAM-dependent methyltransferase
VIWSRSSVAVPDSLVHRLYGEPRYNGTLLFYNEVRQYLTPQSRVLNLGAGPATESPIRTLKGEVAEVIGADVDTCVLDNPELDRAVMIEDGHIPIEDAAFDVIVSDYVFEHVGDPAQFLGEAARVLRPGGSLFFRTPNFLHYVAIISAVTPHRVHGLLANAVRANPSGSQEPWRTHYRMNTVGRLRRLGREAGLDELTVKYVEMEPSYLRFNTAAFLIGTAYERLVNSTLLLAPVRANLFGRFTRSAG